MHLLTTRAVLSLSLACGFGAAGWAEARPVIVEIENSAQPRRWLSTAEHPFGAPARAPAVFPLVYAFHSGELDWFDMGHTADAELADMAKEPLPAPLIAVTREEHPEAVVNFITNNFFGYDSPVDLRNFEARVQELDPHAHRFFSFVGKVVPSDDAFVGNDDPQRFEVFDEAGNFLGPFVIDIYGTDVLDAGARANIEQDVQFISDRGFDLESGELTSEPIRNHPGYIGSVANPSTAQPGILGKPGVHCGEPELAVGCFALTPQDGDFKLPGYHLARIRISAGVSTAMDGFWFDPRRSGEGFNFSISGPTAIFSMAMYTYDAEGQGSQMWLVGSGTAEGATVTVPMHVTSGGRFGAETNPVDVVRTDWGAATVRFETCDRARITFAPAEVGVDPPPDYLVQRVSAPTPEQRARCGTYSLGLDFPPDDTWPTDADYIEPDAPPGG